MKNRTRPARIEFRVTEQERQLIQKKMEQLGTKNMGAYLRKMAIDGYIIKMDYTEQKKLDVYKRQAHAVAAVAAVVSFMDAQGVPHTLRVHLNGPLRQCGLQFIHVLE